LEWQSRDELPTTATTILLSAGRLAFWNISRCLDEFTLFYTATPVSQVAALQQAIDALVADVAAIRHDTAALRQDVSEVLRRVGNGRDRDSH
jgi:hypothetical protein